MTNRRPPVSIVMPLRDAADSLGAALQSIGAQSMSDWELVAVNDGSVDETGSILAEWAGRDQRVRVIDIPPQGIVAALDAGCAAARGEWVARMDGDDVMHPERLERQLEHARRFPDLGVVSCRVGFGAEAPGYRAHIDWINSLLSPCEIALRRFIEAPVAHPSVMFRRELLKQHGGYRAGDFPEDYELWLRWLDAGVRFGKVDRELLVWNDPPSRLSRTDPRYSVARFYEIKCHWLARWLRAEVDPARRLWLWGAGRVTRRRFDPLEREGLAFEGFIDVDPKKANRHRDGRLVRMADDLPDKPGAFLVIGVGNRGARDRIHAHLAAAGRVEGRDFIHAA